MEFLVKCCGIIAIKKNLNWTGLSLTLVKCEAVSECVIVCVMRSTVCVFVYFERLKVISCSPLTVCRCEGLDSGCACSGTGSLYIYISARKSRPSTCKTTAGETGLISKSLWWAVQGYVLSTCHTDAVSLLAAGAECSAWNSVQKFFFISLIYKDCTVYAPFKELNGRWTLTNIFQLNEQRLYCVFYVEENRDLEIHSDS